MIQLIRGFKDILPREMQLWKNAIEIVSSLLGDFGYSEICTPLMEKIDLFVRSIGEKTDIVEKEMYTFSDRKGSLIALRPEATASIVRAYIQHKMYSKNSVTRLYTFGPMFRRERPQKGRYRQFYQLDVEAFGVKSSYIDAEIIFVLHTLLNRLSVKETVVHLNSLGCSDCRPLFKDHVSDMISRAELKLCSNCRDRKNRNPLRVLDCKVKTCREVISEIKPITDFLCYDCKKHFDKVISLLSSLRIPFKLDKYLVRGLDYYTRTIFEVHYGNLGTQTAIAGGGRYDKLVKSLGGPDVPAVGFAIGFNRLLEVTGLSCISTSQHPDIFFAVLGEKPMQLAFEWQMRLNNMGVRVMIGHFNQSLKSQMRQANRVNAPHVLIIGEQEVMRGEVVLRCMKTSSQTSIPINDVVATMKDKIDKLNQDSVEHSSFAKKE